MSRLGELLVRENLISLPQLQKAQEEQRKTGERLGYSLTKLGIVNEQELTNFLSKQYGVPSINLGEFEIDARRARSSSRARSPSSISSSRSTAPARR